ncbi:MAG TPA: triphosphoribosyl-dephospho-CoA synthase [Planctomycetaceae bacterium]|nr:triphosphoribosyl-dephospho-CoA synthase [Planctomycetaceae bacterium]
MLSCLLEATAKKPGNVHPGASFADLTYQDFVRSAHLIAPSFAQGAEWGVGRIVFDAVERTRLGVGRNTNLGILLLLAPLALVPADVALRDGIGNSLAGLTRDDAALVYASIRLANPGGLGRVEREDVASAPSVTLLEAMRLAADRDRIAAQYTSGFSTVLAGAERLAASRLFPDRWEESIIGLHLWLMAEFPDTLIGRKCGPELARESSLRARRVLEAGWPEREHAAAEFDELDRWLRADGNRRNPGTTADLVAGSLFAALRDGLIEPPEVNFGDQAPGLERGPTTPSAV